MLLFSGNSQCELLLRIKISLHIHLTNNSITANTFALGSSDATTANEGYDDLCYTNINSPGRSEDYLFIAEATRQTFPNVRATRFCGNSINGVTVICEYIALEGGLTGATADKSS